MNLTGYTFDVEKGVVIGKRGRPVGRVCNKTRVLAAAFGVSVSTINRVRAGRVWSHNRRGEA